MLRAQREHPGRSRNNSTRRATEPSLHPRHIDLQAHLLHRTIGNRAVLRLLRSGALQARLTVSRPDDIYEREADRAADEVLRMPENAVRPASPPLKVYPFAQRQDVEEEEELKRKAVEEEEEALRAKAGEEDPPAVSADVENSIRALSGRGAPLSESTRSFMEPRFGANFSGVHVHTGDYAAGHARTVSAEAFTVGHDIVFGAGRYAPETAEGRRLLAHELAHIVQQNGPAARPMHAARQAAGAPAAAPATAALASQPTVSISRQGGTGSTFISTETVSFTAQVAGIPAGGAAPAQPTWTVQGLSPNSGNGNPHTAANQSNFSFVPNPTNRPTTGSRTPNDPIRYRIDAQVGGATASYALEQDETDIIRQEYVDFGAAAPSRADIVVPAIATFNTGNYTRIVDRGMNNALTGTQTQFQALTQQAAAPAQPQPPPAGGAAPPAVPVPAVSAVSGYRNPRRNVAAGSQFPVTSRHVQGSALDLTVPGANATLWDRLRQAGANAGNTSICEHGPTQLLCNDPTIDHVHIQW